MKKKTKILTVSVIALLGVLIVAANVWRVKSPVRDIRVNIQYDGADTLSTGVEVTESIRRALPTLYSTHIGKVDLKAVERASQSPYLRNCEAATSISGSVVLFAVQRRPIVRVFAGGEEFYLDDRGCKVPISNIGSCNVIVASGRIPLKGLGLKQVWKLAMYLDSHPDVAPLFDQIYRDEKGDLFLTPKMGNHVVQVGSEDYLDEKFANLKVFYRKGLPQVGWDTYRQVSVKYHGQVVCRRRQAQPDIITQPKNIN